MALGVTVHHRVDTGRRECGQDAAWVGGGDIEPVLRRRQHIAAGLAIVALRHFVQKIGQAQIDHACQGADDLALWLDESGSVMPNTGACNFLPSSGRPIVVWPCWSAAAMVSTSM